MESAPPEPWLNPYEREAWLALAGLLTKLPASLDGQLQADAGLSFIEYMTLALLAERPSRSMQMSEIASYTCASLSRLSHTATRLEKQGFITRQRMPGHGRRTQAILTDAGLAKVESCAEGHVRHVRRIVFDELSYEDVGTVAATGNKIMRAIDERS
ncbi:MarR family transcriptional regulator [Micrococcales bacterium 31B]|nr:MarR family transcriptional regulator [Micrococcales bacterium 31B]